MLSTDSTSPRPEEEVDLTLQVANVQHCAEDVLAFELVDPDGKALPEWSPGAHVDVTFSDQLVRQYSLCGHTEDASRWRIAVLWEHDSRGGSTYMHEEVRVGTLLSVRGPRNNFRLEPAERYQFIAGGIGITPILPMVRAASAAGVPWSLVYGGRTRDSMAFTDELQHLPGGMLEITPQDEEGPLDLHGALAESELGTAVYCCGPEPLIEAVESQCANWSRGTLHRERFSPKPDPGANPDGSFEVRLVRSGVQLHVPAYEPLLDVLENGGYELDNSCRAGICGTCLVNVVGGVPDHLDDVLSDEERESGEVMLPCVSRARSNVLELDL